MNMASQKEGNYSNHSRTEPTRAPITESNHSPREKRIEKGRTDASTANLGNATLKPTDPGLSRTITPTGNSCAERDFTNGRQFWQSFLVITTTASLSAMKFGHVSSSSSTNAMQLSASRRFILFFAEVWIFHNQYLNQVCSRFKLPPTHSMEIVIIIIG